MEILAVGDSVRSNTGYGRVSQHVFLHFLRRKHEVSQIAWQHSEPPERVIITDRNGMVGTVTMFPPHTTDDSGAMSTVTHVNTRKPHMVYNSNDIFTCTQLIKSKNALTYPLFLVNYGVIDAPDAVHWYKETIDQINVLVTPSKYGFSHLEKIRSDGLYIPHGVDLSIYHPMQNKDLLKEKLGVFNKFVFGAVHRNIIRKLIPYVLQAFANLKYRHNLKDIVLYLVMDPVEASGYDVKTYAKMLNLTVSWTPNQPADIMLHHSHLNYTISLSDEQLAEAYNTFDVLVSATMSEGFGLPTLESQACGTPVIIPDHSANTELVENHGWLYPTAKNIDGSSVMFPFRMTAGNETIMYGYPVPDVVALEQSMLDAYNNSTKRESYSKLCSEFAKPYDWDLILPQWDEVLNRCSDFWDKQKAKVDSIDMEKIVNGLKQAQEGVLANGSK
jgi:glycosyltransferase involved in cell wall biosynthesis